MHAVNEYLKSLRLKSGKSQIELANKVGFSGGQFVSNWERGKCLPPPNKLRKIGKYLNAHMKTLIELYVEAKTEEIRGKI